MIPATPPAIVAGLPATPPYLQNGRPGEVTLVWRSAHPQAARVRVWDMWGRVAFDLTRAPEPQPEVRVPGLVPGMPYRYEVEEAGRALGTGRFTAPRGSESRHLRFAAFGDMGSGAPVQLAVAERMAAWKPEFVIATGDIVYPSGGAADYGPKFFQPYRALLAESVFYPSLGNHDVKTGNGAPYLAAFALPERPGGERYYAFDAGPARFWVLDSTQSMALDSPQIQWLQADAAQSRAKWKFAVFHHPPYSSGIHGSSRLSNHLAPLFSKLGFAVVFTGHDHDYERTQPQGGVTYLVTGGGGAMIYGVTPKPFSAIAAPLYHFIGLTIYENTLAAMVYTADGKLLDAWSIQAPPAQRPVSPWQFSGP